MSQPFNFIVNGRPWFLPPAKLPVFQDIDEAWEWADETFNPGTPIIVTDPDGIKLDERKVANGKRK